MKDKNEIIHFFSRHIREILEQAEVDFEQLQEIRLRAYKPFLIRLGGEEYPGDNGACGKIFPLCL